MRYIVYKIIIKATGSFTIVMHPFLSNGHIPLKPFICFLKKILDVQETRFFVAPVSNGHMGDSLNTVVMTGTKTLNQVFSYKNFLSYLALCMFLLVFQSINLIFKISPVTIHSIYRSIFITKYEYTLRVIFSLVIYRDLGQMSFYMPTTHGGSQPTPKGCYNSYMSIKCCDEQNFAQCSVLSKPQTVFLDWADLWMMRWLCR